MSRDRTPPRQAWTLVIASIGVFMTALDALVVATALPVLRADLGASLPDLEWTVNAYNVAFACLLLTGGALGDRFGRRRMFTLGLAGFSVASAAAALSPTVEALIAARAAQGAAAAIVMPLTLTLISDAFPGEKRGMAIGLWGGIGGVAVAAGPVVGGAIIDGIDWQWIFWLNVPIGLALVPLAASRLSESYGRRARLDFGGLALGCAGVLGVTWGLVRGNAAGWGSAEVVSALAAGVALVGAFLVWESRTRHPMLPLALFRDRGFAAANGVSFFMAASLFGALFLMSQFFQVSLGDSPLEAGLHTLPWTAAPIVIAPLAGALADRFGSRPFMAGGLALQAVGLGWVAAIAAPGMAYGELALALGVAGVGISMCFPTVANAVMAAAPPEEAGVASSTNSAIRELGGVMGIAILAAVFAHQAALAEPVAFAERFSPALWVGAGLSAAGIVAALLSPRRAAHEVSIPAPAVRRTGVTPEFAASD